MTQYAVSNSFSSVAKLNEMPGVTKRQNIQKYTGLDMDSINLAILF